jgi:endonuclease/exonuclease/phosphatase family metal-dependent hydrolase
MHRLRIMTFNIAHGRGLTPIQGFTSPRKIRVNLRRIAALISRLEPDVVAMQEIDENSRWSGSFDHLDYLRVYAGFPHAVFGINNRRTGLINLSYGNALLSRYPLLNTETVVFGRRKVGEKGFLFAELDVGGRRVPIVNLHLHSSSRAMRLYQLERLTSWLREKRRARAAHWAQPPVICGDFNNSSIRDDATAALWSHLSRHDDYLVRPQAGGTFPSPLPRRLLDFIFLPTSCRDVQCRVVRTLLSDHCPVLLDFSFG